MPDQSKVRWKICTFLLLAVAVSFLDRLNIGILGKPLEEQFHIGNTQLGTIFSAFGIGYALFQLPGGMLADRLGPRRVITAAVILWSCLTALCAIPDRLPLSVWIGLPAALAAIRLLIGIAQAPLLTSANRVVANWMASSERARGNGLFVMGVGVGGIVTPPLLAWLMQQYGWRLSFVICAAVGLVYATAWHWYSTERPEQHAGVDANELAHIRGDGRDAVSFPQRVRWAVIFSDRNVLLLVLSYGLQGYTTYVFYTWFYLYLVNVRKLPLVEAGFWSSVPFAAFALMSLLGGWCSDLAVRRWGRTWGRRACAFTGLFGACTVLLIGSRIVNPYLAVFVLSMGAGFNAFSTVSFWAATIDISRDYAGSLSGLMNTAGNIAGAISPTLTPYLAERYGWTTAIDFAAVMIGSAGFVWLMIDAGRQLSMSTRTIDFQRSAVPK